MRNVMMMTWTRRPCRPDMAELQMTDHSRTMKMRYGSLTLARTTTTTRLRTRMDLIPIGHMGVTETKTKTLDQRMRLTKRLILTSMMTYECYFGSQDDKCVLSFS